MLTEQEKTDCLAYGLFDGTRDRPDRIVVDKIVVANDRYYDCWICSGDCEAHTHNRVTKWVSGGKIVASRICEICCGAMARAPIDGGDAIKRRWSLGHSLFPVNGNPYDAGVDAGRGMGGWFFPVFAALVILLFCLFLFGEYFIRFVPL